MKKQVLPNSWLPGVLARSYAALTIATWITRRNEQAKHGCAPRANKCIVVCSNMPTSGQAIAVRAGWPRKWPRAETVQLRFMK